MRSFLTVPTLKKQVLLIQRWDIFSWLTCSTLIWKVSAGCPKKNDILNIVEHKNVHTKTKIKLAVEREIVKIIYISREAVMYARNSADKCIANQGGHFK